MYTPMNLRKFFQRSQSNVPIQAAHMTWASRTMAGTVAKTRRFLSRQIWVWPIIAVTLLLAIGWGVHGSIEYTMQSNLRSQLETLRDVEVAMLRTWIVSHQNNAASVAGDTEVRQLTVSLLESLSDPSLVEKSVTNESKIAAGQLVKQLGPAMSAHDYDSFFIATRETVVAAMRTEAIGMEIPEKFRHAIGKVFDGQTAVLPPFPSVLPQRDHSGRKRTGVPMMSVLAPIVDEHLQPVAALGLLIRPEKEFTRILQLGQLGQSGETYAFNREGLLLSNSRFDHDLILLGLLPDVEDSESILHLLVRDPGKDMTRGFRPKVRRGEMPLTRMAEAAVDGQTEADVVGYRGYRGVPVVGAWTWLDDYEFGVATEIDFAEAYRPLTILKRTFWGLLGLLAASAVAIFGFTVRVAHLQRQAREAAIEARQLGQYKLEEKLGEGAMGVVYKGRHAMLRRPTAIKLLDADKVTDVSITRFEREVQVTSHLNHPNTVAIYDYGRTPEEVFYYAMEYLDGLDLQQLVDTYGPQPAGRVIYLLRQVCGSLYEAHSTGLVHRDIKPANIMLSRRGGEGDVIKVLDFGLVKARDGEHASLDEDQSLAGTPLYMSPEAIQLPGSVDACSDLYALGAVGYFLLTGHPVFEADDLVELCRQHTSESPQPLSDRLGSPVPADLENAILACLEKDRSKRPQTARELANRLRQCAAAIEWTVDEADTWWGRHERGKGQAQPVLVAKDTPGSQYDATIAH
jgi:tRNA A-37 threonylcarbamoyl transferase component Bud32